MSAQGFTLVEMLLSVGIIAMLVGVSVPVYQTFQNRNDLDLTAEGIASMLRRAQTYSRGVRGDSQWGVRVQSTGATLFKGASYATRDSAFDEPLEINATTSVSGLSEVVFSKLEAAPSTTGTVTLNAGPTGTKAIALNSEGMVSY